ncbi:S-adenosyl-L-methionine-dependent methyltransferase [Biscogniauxia sp. FL1348]|nr:S-adenosyl-L-methionine-dependent methyltransferase [Biscogniauxia sp. FL1348]
MDSQDSNTTLGNPPDLQQQAPEQSNPGVATVRHEITTSTNGQEIRTSDSPVSTLPPETTSVAPVSHTNSTCHASSQNRLFEHSLSSVHQSVGDGSISTPSHSISHLVTVENHLPDTPSLYDSDNGLANLAADDPDQLDSPLMLGQNTDEGLEGYGGLVVGQQEAENGIGVMNQIHPGVVIVNINPVSDAGYESDTETTASTSIASSIFNHSFEHGRRYHKFREGSYNFPNDDVEQQREDMKHAMVKMLCQKLHFAPIGRNPQEILDVGTGTGIWAIEMGDSYPSANVLGVDLSPIQPQWVPPNVRFIVDDVESSWVYPRNHFDYIHSRHTVMAIKDWTKMLRQSYEHLKPGGWVELQEIHHFPMSTNGDLPAEHPVAQYWSYIREGLSSLGVNFEFASEGHIAEVMRQCGYVNVTEKVFHIPIGTWPRNKKLKSVGLYWKTILLDGVQAIALGPMTRGLRWRREQVETFLAAVRKAYHDNSCLMYMPLVCVYGQKPEDSY